MNKKLISGIAILSLLNQLAANPFRWHRDRWVNQYLLDLEHSLQTDNYVPFINLFKNYGPVLEKFIRRFDNSQGHRYFDLKDKYIRLAGGYWNSDELTNSQNDVYKFQDRFDRFYKEFKEGRNREQNLIKMLETYTYLRHMHSYGRPAPSADARERIEAAIENNPQLMKNIDLLKYHWPY